MKLRLLFKISSQKVFSQNFVSCEGILPNKHACRHGRCVHAGTHIHRVLDEGLVGCITVFNRRLGCNKFGIFYEQ